MAVQELELESLISQDKLTETLQKPKISSSLTNKSLCYIVDTDAAYYESESKIVIAVFGDNKSECETQLLTIPPSTNMVSSKPRELFTKLDSDTELLKNTDFRHTLIQVVFQQDSFDAIELLLHQNIFSWEGFLRISVRFPLVLKFALETKLPNHEFPLKEFADGNTLLHDCVEYDCAESMRLIFDTLHNEAFQSKKVVTKEMIQAFMDKRNDLNLNALYLSVAKPSHGCLTQLLKAGAGIGMLLNIHGL